MSAISDVTDSIEVAVDKLLVLGKGRGYVTWRR